MNSQKPVMVVSVDVEALPARADKDHVKKLIWGDFGEDTPVLGLKELCDEAENVGAKLTCLVDFAEIELYGKDIIEVAEYIEQRGHDLQLHLHPEILPDNFWSRNGLSKPTAAPNKWTGEQATFPFEYFCEKFKDIKGRYPDAFRAGSFRSNPTQIKIMGNKKIPISSNLAYSAYKKQNRFPVSSPDIEILTHYNGVLEFPVSHVELDNGDYTSLVFPWPRRSKYSLDEGLKKLADKTNDVAILLLHSWAMLQHPKRGDKYFMNGTDEIKNNFRLFLQTASKYFDFTTFDELAKNKEQLKQKSIKKLSEKESALETSDIKAKSERLKSTIKISDGRIYGMVIGGMRCGTTASFKNITQHPEICAAKKKEVHFFSSDENWEKGLEWYRQHWRQYDDNHHKVCFESCTHYTKFPRHRDVPKRMFESGQDIRPVYLVRDPIERAESHLAFQVGKGYIPGDDLIKRNQFLKGIALQYSSYYFQMKEYLKYFNKSDILIVSQEQLKAEPLNTYPKIFRHFGVDEDFVPETEVLNDRKMYIEKSGSAGQGTKLSLTEDEKSLFYGLVKNDTTNFIKEFKVDTRFWNTYTELNQADNRE